MALAALEVVGVLFGIASSIPFFESLLPAQDPDQTTVRIGVGLSAEEGSNMGGHAPAVALFDVVGRPVGMTTGLTGWGNNIDVAEGGFHDIKVEADDDIGGRQSEYLSVSAAGNDAICISYITMTWPDGGKRAWFGDVGYQCGATWYHSHNIAGPDEYKPKCVWLDGDGSNDIATKGLGMHITDFTATKQRAAYYQQNIDAMCKSPPRFKVYTELSPRTSIPYFDPPLTYEPGTLVDVDLSKVMVEGSKRPDRPKPDMGGGPHSQPVFEKKRSNVGGHTTRAKKHAKKPTAQRFAGRLITSKAKEQSAKELCESSNSMGPDFVSHDEGLYCDMSEKKLWPVCVAGPHEGACFDVKKQEMVPAKGLRARQLEERGEVVPAKSYHTVQEW